MPQLKQLRVSGQINTMTGSVMTLVSWWKTNAQLDLLKTFKITKNSINAATNLHGLTNKDVLKSNRNLENCTCCKGAYRCLSSLQTAKFPCPHKSSPNLNADRSLISDMVQKTAR